MTSWLTIREYLAQAYVPSLPVPMQEIFGDVRSRQLSGDLYFLRPNLENCKTHELGAIAYDLMDCLFEAKGIGKARSVDLGYVLFINCLRSAPGPASILFGDINKSYNEYFYSRHARSDYPQIPVRALASVRTWWLDNGGSAKTPSFREWIELNHNSRVCNDNLGNTAMTEPRSWVFDSVDND